MMGIHEGAAPSTERLMVAATMAPVVPESAQQSLPPHLTVFPWFSLRSERWQAFDEGMQDVMMETNAPRIQGGDMAVFGLSEVVHVRRLNRVTASFNLIRGFDIHAGVYCLVHVLGEDYDDTFTGVNWHPHVSESVGFTLAEGEEVQLDNLTVFQKLTDGQKKVRARYQWGHDASAA